MVTICSPRRMSPSFASPNPNVFAHPRQAPETWGGAIDHVLHVWFPPVDWHEVGIGIRDSIRGGVGWFFDLFTMNAKADSLTVDSTTVSVVDPAAATCTTSQSAAAGDNAILVMLSNRGPTAYTTVTYGSVSLSLIPGTASSGTGFVRTELWFYLGVIPSGAQTMTATLVSGTAKHVCATVLLGGVWATTPTAGGTTASGTSTNPNISISPASAGELAFAVLAIRGTTAPTAVTGTGATATSLYGITPTQCTAGGSSLCSAGADMPFPGTAITWTDGNNTDWVVAAVRVLPFPNCGAATGNCYRIGAGGTWATGGNWSNTSGGAACGCTPVATNIAIFNANPTGTTTLAAATTIASIDMTNFTGTLDTTASNWALTVNGPFAIQGTFQARGSTITATGDVDVLTAATIVNLGASTWTVNGLWTNLSTSASWTAGTSTVTIRDAASGTLTFAALAGGTNEFNNLTLDDSVTTSITYTMGTNPLRMGATLTIRNSTGGATGSTILTTSASNLGITAGGLTITTFGSLIANASAVAINGNANVSAANGYVVMGSSTWSVTGTWTNASTSASWSPGTGTVTFTSATGGTMTFAGTNLPGNEFNNISFTSSAASAQTFTMATRALIWGGTLTISDGSSTTALATANLGLTGGALSVGNGGILTANASTVTVSSVAMTGGTSGTITLTTSAFTSTGNWDTSGAGSVFTKGTSTVTMSGVANIAILNASNNFNNLVISAAGTVTQTGLVDVSGTLTVNAGSALASSTFTLTVAALAANMAGGITGGAAGTKTIAGNVSIAASGYFSFGATTWNFGGSWTNSTTSGSWSGGTGTVVFNSGSSRTMTFANLGASEFNNVQFSPTAAATFTMATNGLRWGGTLTLNNNATLSTANLALTGPGGNLTVNNGATLTAGTSAVSVINVTMTGGTSGTITASGSWTVAGNWDTSGAGSVFTASSSTVTMSGAAKTVRILNASNGFGALTISGTVSAASAITLAGLLTVSGTFDTTATNYGLSVGGGLTVSGAAGVVRSNGSTVSVTGNVSVNNAGGYITSGGAGSWTVSGSWTNASTSASWNFASPITFNSSASQTMTFAVLPGAAAEFNDIAFNSGAATVTFTMATNRLIWSGTLSVQGGAGATTLATSNLPLTGGALTIGDTGILTANASAVSASNVAMTGGASGTLTLTTGAWTVTGNWDTSGAGSIFTGGASIVTMTGAGTTVKILNASNGFAALTVSGTVSAAAALTTAGLVTVSGTLDTTAANYGLTIGGGLTVSGASGVLRANASIVSVAGNLNVNNAAGYIASMAGGSWTASGSWTNSSTSASWSFAAPITFNSSASRTMTFGNPTLEFAGNVTFNSGASTVTFTMAANSLDVGGTLSISGGAGTTTLNTSGSNLAINAVTLVVNAGGALTANGSTITVTSADTHLGTFTVGGSNVVVNASGGSINITQTVNNLMVSPAVSTTFTGSLTWTGTLALTNAGTVAFGTNSVTSSGAATFTFASATITMSSGNWDTSSATTFTATSSTVTFSGTGNLRIGGSASFGALTVSGGTRTLQSQLTTAGLLTLSGGTLAKGTNALTANAGLAMSGGALTSTSGAVSITGNVSIAAASYIVFGSETWTVSGSWTDNSTSASWSIGTATVSFNASAAQTMTFAALPGNAPEFYNVTFNSGASTVTFTMTTNALAWFGILTVQGGGGATTLATGNLGLIGGAIAVGNAGVLAANASSVSASGLTMIGGASGTLTLTTGSWAVSGNWNTSGAGSVFSKGTSTVTLIGAGQTVSILNASNGFYNLTVSGTITQSTAIDVSNSLTVSSTLTTGGLNITGGSNLFVPDGGTLAAGTSTPTFTNVTMTGAVSGTITLTGTWTVSGSWDSTGAGAVLNSGTSTVIFTGTSQTISLASGQMFYNLTIGGTVSINSSVTAAATLTVNNGAVLTKTGQTIAFNTLVENGTGSIVDGAITVVNFSVTNSDGTNLMAISVFTTWTIDANYTWTHSSTVATSTITFTIGGNTSGQRFNVTKDAVDFTNGLVNGSGQIIFTMLGSDPVVDVRLTSPCGGNRYWIGGTGSWSQTGHWADSSGGVNGCSVPNSSNPVFFDSNSGGGNATISMNVAVTSLNTTGWTGTIAIGSFDLAVSGDIIHAAGIISIGASSNAGLTATGTLTLSGSAVLDGSGVASLVAISGDTSIASTSAYFRMGSGTWTFAGSWSNSSTSTNWVAGTGVVIFDSPSSRTFTFANLVGNEFHDVTFQSTAGSGAITFSMAANGLRWSGLLLIQDSAGSTTTLATSNLSLTGGSLAVGDSGVLIANASSVAVVDVTMTGGTSGTLTLTSGSWTVNGQWDTSGAGSTFARGTSTVTMSGTSASVATLDATNGFNNLVVSGTITQNTALEVRGTLSVTGRLTTSGNNITGGANLAISGGGSLIGTASSIVVSGVTMNDAATNSISLTAGSSTVTLTAASGTIALGPAQGLGSLIIAGNLSLASPLTVSSLTISSGGLAKGPHSLTVNGNVTLAGGYLTSTLGSVSIAGNVNVSSASSYIAFGSGTWTISGNWTNASTSASWSAGSAVVTFDAATDQTMTFAGANLAGNEFSTVEFDSGSSTTTFTMTSDGLAAQTITIQGGP